MSDCPVILWFRRDLRLGDHPALHGAMASGVPIVPPYVLDDDTPSQWQPGGASRWWLTGSLRAADADLRARLAPHPADSAALFVSGRMPS